MSEIDFFNLSFPDKFECKLDSLQIVDPIKGIVRANTNKFVIPKSDIKIVQNILKEEQDKSFVIGLQGRRYYEV